MPDELAARFGIALEISVPELTEPEDDLLALIEEAVARGVARGLREALGQRPPEGHREEEVGAGADRNLGSTLNG